MGSRGRAIGVASDPGVRSEHYVAELEQLALECERLVPTLKDCLAWQPTSEGEDKRSRDIRRVIVGLESRLGKIAEATVAKEPAKTSCKCYAKVEKYLAARHPHVKLNPVMVLIKKAKGSVFVPRCRIATTRAKGSRKPDIAISAAYCPFCGVHDSPLQDGTLGTFGSGDRSSTQTLRNVKSKDLL